MVGGRGGGVFGGGDGGEGGANGGGGGWRWYGEVSTDVRWGGRVGGNGGGGGTPPSLLPGCGPTKPARRGRLVKKLDRTSSPDARHWRSNSSHRLFAWLLSPPIESPLPPPPHPPTPPLSPPAPTAPRRWRRPPPPLPSLHPVPAAAATAPVIAPHCPPIPPDHAAPTAAPPSQPPPPPTASATAPRCVSVDDHLPGESGAFSTGIKLKISRKKNTVSVSPRRRPWDVASGAAPPPPPRTHPIPSLLPLFPFSRSKRF